MILFELQLQQNGPHIASLCAACVRYSILQGAAPFFGKRYRYWTHLVYASGWSWAIGSLDK